MAATGDDGQSTGAPAAGLVDQVYATVLEPGRYDELMAAWERHIADAIRELDGPEAAGRAPSDRDEIERHFLNAFTILERLGRPLEDRRPIEALVEADPRPAMLLGSGGRIVAANGAAAELFGTAAGQSLAALPVDADGMRQIREALARMGAEPPGRLLAVARAFSARDGSAFIVALTRAPARDGEAALGLLGVADLAWNDRIGAVLRQAFGLSEAECEIARSLMAGASARDIAEARKSSIETVRTQMKAVLRKTEAHSQGELIRMTAALAQFDMGGDGRIMARGRRASALFDVLRRGSRKLVYTRIGAPQGRLVLFVHGMLDGYAAPLFNREVLAARNINLIVPARPGFGGSDHDGEAEGAPERFAADAEALLDHLGIARCPVLGHLSGALYAYAIAARVGPRITHILNVSGTVPVTSSAQISALAPRQRIVAYTTKYAPRFSRLILRAAVALIDSGGHHAFMKALYESAVADWPVAQRADVLPHLSDGYDFMVAQGYKAFEIDARLLMQDWSRHVAPVAQPVTLLHGPHDPAVPVWSVREFAGRYPNIDLCEVEGAGRLIFFARPDLVLDALEAALQAS